MRKRIDACLGNFVFTHHVEFEGLTQFIRVFFCFYNELVAHPIYLAKDFLLRILLSGIIIQTNSEVVEVFVNVNAMPGVIQVLRFISCFWDKQVRLINIEWSVKLDDLLLVRFINIET